MVARRIFDDAARAYESAIAIHEIHQLSARRGGLYRVDLFRDCWCEKRHQSHRWTRWPGHHAGCAGRRRARRFRLCDGQRGVLEISVVSSYSGRGRTADFLRGDGRRGPGIPLVQHASGAAFYGRCRRARARRRAGDDCRHRPAGDRAVCNGRRVCRRNAFGDAAGRLVQIYPQALWRRPPPVQDGAAASPLVAGRLERNAGRRALLDYHADAGFGWAFNAEVTLRKMTVFGTLNQPETLILGLGISGLSMARWCARHGCRLRIADTRATPPNLPQLRAEGLDAELITGALRPALLDGIELLAISPGLSPRAAEIALLLAEARARSIPVWGELDFFAQALRATEVTAYGQSKVIAITGTNGKTTTAALVGRVCKRAGYQSCVAGNIGMALLDALGVAVDKQKMPDIWVLELSSFQLESNQTFAPDVAAALNITPDHLDWHGNFDAYAAAKGRIFGASAVRILNRDDAHSMRFALNRAGQTDVGQFTFGLSAPQHAGEYGWMETGDGAAWLALAEAAEAAETCAEISPAAKRARRAADHAPSGIVIKRLMPASALAIRGKHNISNVLAALALCRALDIPLAPLLHGLRDYRGEPHRFQCIARINGVDFIDDSKGTNVGALLAALKGAEAQKIVLIAGGVSKGQDFSPLAEPVARVCRAVMLIGRDASLLRVALEPSGVSIAEYATLEEAVRAAASIADLAIRCCYRRRAPVSICSAITGIALKCSTARLKRQNLEHFSARLHKERTRRQYAQYGEREVTQGKPMKNALNHHDPFNTTVCSGIHRRCGRSPHAPRDA